MPNVSGTVSFFARPGPNGGTDYVFVWTATAGGVVEYLCEQTEALAGTIWEVITIPSISSVPTDNYDVYLYDSNGLDVLNGLGVDRDTATRESKIIVAGATTTGTFTARTMLYNPYRLKIENAGNATGGTVIVRCYDPALVPNALMR